MTVLVGIRCQGGIVIGADSAATFSSGQHRTIEQPVKKIAIIDDKVIVAGTGEIGMGQRFCSVVQAAWTAKAFTKAPLDAARYLTTKAVEDFSSTKATMGTYGALVAFPAGRTVELCEFAITNFQPELKTDNLWYVSMGSGQAIADPCLGFIRQVFWSGGVPSCEDGVFAVVWTLSQAIALNPGGVNGPMQVATLTTAAAGPVARMLETAEIDEHIANVDGALEHLRQYRRELRGDNNVSADLPRPPQAP